MTDSQKIFSVAIRLQPGEKFEISCGDRLASIKTEVYKEKRLYMDRTNPLYQRNFSIHTSRKKPGTLIITAKEPMQVDTDINHLKKKKNRTLDELLDWSKKEAGSIRRQGFTPTKEA